MSWCPKCKTEYVEGIEVCADCGSRLVDSLQETVPEVIPEIDSQEECKTEEIDFQKREAMMQELQEKKKAASAGAYVESSKKAEEFKSGGYMLMIVGALGILVVVLILTDVIPLHLNLFSKYLTTGVMGALFVLFLIMGGVSLKSYKGYARRAKEEDSLTDNLNRWCRENLKKEEIDAGIDVDTEELRYFCRTEKIKALIQQSFFNLDESFLDNFIDEYYPRIFGESSE